MVFHKRYIITTNTIYQIHIILFNQIIQLNHNQHSQEMQNIEDKNNLQRESCLEEFITPLIRHAHSQTSLIQEQQTDVSPTNDQNLHINSDQKNSENTKENKTESEIDSFQELILKNIKSKEEIEIQSKQNEQILQSLNSNIDDLFKKISQLTDQITTQSPASEAFSLKQRQRQKQKQKQRQKNKASSQTQIQIDNQELIKQNVNGLYNSSTIIPVKQNYVKISSKVSAKIKQPKYKSIFLTNNQSNFKQSSINMRLFQTGRSLGCGKFGEVLQCRQNRSSSLYALKKIFKSAINEYQMQEQVLQQIKILSMIDHPNIIKSYESFTDQFHIFILMEYVQGKSLVTKFKSTQSDVKILIKQVLQALQYLHQKKIAHRDIKPENIIVTQNNVVKICDFGWSSTNSADMNIICGTLDYVCPQMVNGEPYTEKVDLWNIGILTYELIFGVAPFKSSSRAKTFQKVKNMEYEFPDGIKISAQCKQFILGFLQPQSCRKQLEWGLTHKFLVQSSDLCNNQQMTKQFLAKVQQIMSQQ